MNDNYFDEYMNVSCYDNYYAEYRRSIVWDFIALVKGISPQDKKALFNAFEQAARDMLKECEYKAYIGKGKKVLEGVRELCLVGPYACDEEDLDSVAGGTYACDEEDLDSVAGGTYRIEFLDDTGKRIAFLRFRPWTDIIDLVELEKPLMGRRLYLSRRGRGRKPEV